jgi:hypothetical protein
LAQSNGGGITVRIARIGKRIGSGLGAAAINSIKNKSCDKWTASKARNGRSTSSEAGKPELFTFPSASFLIGDISDMKGGYARFKSGKGVVQELGSEILSLFEFVRLRTSGRGSGFQAGGMNARMD